MMKQAQHLQAEMQKMQARLAEEKVTGESGGGMVRITMNGHYQVHRVQIDPSVMQDDDLEMLEDLIVAAMNDAVTKIEEKSTSNRASLMAGLQLPPGFKLPF
ncbi:nucleoid-associated protein [Achromatium sp. WMS1]|nr:nucleoid-associated protein [Achromatium sp. WMS1]